MRNRAAMCLAVGTLGLTVVVGVVFIFCVTRRYCVGCPCHVESDYLAIG